MKPTAASVPRVAIVHDWLLTAGGAERVLSRICKQFPEGHLYCLLGDAQLLPPEISPNRFHQSWLGRVPSLRRYYRGFAPVMPLAIESLNLKAYDLVISSAWAFAHGVQTSSNALHLAYIHSPMRWAWDMQEEYLQRWNVSSLVKQVARLPLQRLRAWDRRAGQRPTALLANSRFIQRRIADCWGREAGLLYPPVSFAAPVSTPKHEAYVVVSRLVPYKRVDLVVKAFAHLPDKKLIVAGDGPELGALQALAGPNVQFMGWVTDEQALRLMAGSRGLIQASKEDFGIAVVEAQACGTPVLAYGQGGALEILNPSGQTDTGMFFNTLSPEDLAQTILQFEAQGFDPKACRENAARFSGEAFDQGLRTTLNALGFE
jgi:glycosyltransferase involved in cell wall biosynthesis